MKNRTWDRWRTHFYFTDTLLLWVNRAQVVLLLSPITFTPMLDERVDTIVESSYIINFPFPWISQQISWDGMHLTMKLMVFYHPMKSRREMKPTKERRAYLTLRRLSHLMELWRRRSPSLVLSFYIYMWRKAEFPSNEFKDYVCVVVYSGGKSAVTEKWSHQFNNCSRAGAIHIFQGCHYSVGGSIRRSEPQSHPPSREIKNPTTGILFCGRVYITIQSRGFTDRLRRHRVE